jgi:hypothetical protein
MNLFILSLIPKECAEYMFDKHIVKIILEAVQMLCTAKQLLNPPTIPSSEESTEQLPVKLYKISHKNHPVSIWVRSSLENYLWTLDLVDAMHDEWKFRYNHPTEKEHKSYVLAKYLREHAPKASEFSNRGLLPFAQAMPDEFKNPDDAVAAYRRYYQSEQKSKLTCWKKREKPDWFTA